MVAMNIPMVTWIVVVVFVVLFVVISLCYRKGWWRSNKSCKIHHNFVEITPEQDEFFVPGDPIPGDEEKDSKVN